MYTITGHKSRILLVFLLTRIVFISLSRGALIYNREPFVPLNIQKKNNTMFVISI